MIKIFQIVLLLFFSTFPIYSQISPGELTNAHSNLEGLSNCTKCHEIGQKVLNSKCLSCHSEIQHLINNGKGYHSSSEVKNKNCWACHSEHHGRNFRIINFNPDNFNHSKSGFDLTGSHSKLKCNECHQSKFISDSKIKKRNKTYLGLSTNCNSCHQDHHNGSLGNNCETCHSTEKFSIVESFDHNKTAFKLVGAHEKVECGKCHPKETKDGQTTTKFKGLSFSNCAPCHSDPHKGAFGSDCKSCHSVKSFHLINESAFDHSKTNFPLIGEHKKVKCNDCHKGGDAIKPKFSKCIDCHQDYHKGQFIANNQQKDCSECHDVYGFSPSKFRIEDHKKLSFPLTGSHLAVPCQNCHRKGNEWQFKFTKIDCIACHNNVHGKELSEKYLPENKCDACHSTANWSTISFDHKGTQFELSGKHISTKCADCHYKADSNGVKVFRFSSLNSDCINCHSDIHNNQFSVDGKTNCFSCHAFENWSAVNFDHNNTDFKLDGAHKKLDCSKCHPNVIENGKSFVKFKLEDFKCAFCHSK